MYKLTEVLSVFNTGADVRTKQFDNWYEMQDYIELKTQNMSTEEKELYYFNLKVEEL